MILFLFLMSGCLSHDFNYESKGRREELSQIIKEGDGADKLSSVLRVSWLRYYLSYLVPLGDDVNELNANGWAPIHEAANAGRSYILEKLIKSGAKLDILTTSKEEKDKTFTALMLAVEKGNFFVTDCLLRAGCDIEIRNSEGETALMLAAQNGRIDVCELLIKQGADISAEDSYGRTAFSCAAVSGCKKTCEFLLEKGANLNAVDKGGRTALMRVAACGKREMCELLLSSGSNLNAADKYGRTVLMYAAQYAETQKRHHKEVCELLLDRGADINAVDGEGKTVWDLVFPEGVDGFNADKRGIYELLLKAGSKVDINAVDSNGRTLLIKAAMFKSKEMCKLLLERGSDADVADSGGWTALMHAAFIGQKGICELLLDKGARVDAASVVGKTALMLAAREGYVEICELLLDSGSDVNIEDNNGLSAMVYAFLNSTDEEDEGGGMYRLWVGGGRRSKCKDEEDECEKKYEEVFGLLVDRGSSITSEEEVMLKGSEYIEKCSILLKEGNLRDLMRNSMY